MKNNKELVQELNQNHIKKEKTVDDTLRKKGTVTSGEFSLPNWQSEMLGFISWFSSKFSQTLELESIQDGESQVEKFEIEQSFAENKDELYGALIFLKKNIELLHYISKKITHLKKEDITEFISVLDIFKQISEMIYTDREYYQDIISKFPLENYSFCPTCNSMEESTEFLLCEICNNYLIKGEEISHYFAGNFFEKIIKLPPAMANKLYFQFSGKIQEIQYLKEGEIQRKKIITVPGDSVLGTGKSYQFFTVSQNSKLILEDNTHKVINTLNSKFDELIDMQKDLSLAKDLLSNTEEEKHKPLVCRNCGTKMKLHRTTTYYDTNCDLYSCPKCKMNVMLNFQPIWESNNEK